MMMEFESTIVIMEFKIFSSLDDNDFCFSFRNTKSSQEVVDFVRSHLSERADGEHPVGSILENICESVSTYTIQYVRVIYTLYSMYKCMHCTSI